MAQVEWCRRCGSPEVTTRAGMWTCMKCSHTWRDRIEWSYDGERERLLTRVEKAARAYRRVQRTHGDGSEAAKEFGYLLDDALSTLQTFLSEPATPRVVST